MGFPATWQKFFLSNTATAVVAPHYPIDNGFTHDAHVVILVWAIFDTNFVLILKPITQILT